MLINIDKFFSMMYNFRKRKMCEQVELAGLLLISAFCKNAEMFRFVISSSNSAVLHTIFLRISLFNSSLHYYTTSRRVSKNEL